MKTKCRIAGWRGFVVLSLLALAGATGARAAGPEIPSYELLPTDPSAPHLFAATYATTIGIAVALLGPGAISLDYRLFGPREIMIPPARRWPVTHNLV